MKGSVVNARTDMITNGGAMGGKSSVGGLNVKSGDDVDESGAVFPKSVASGGPALERFDVGGIDGEGGRCIDFRIMKLF